MTQTLNREVPVVPKETALLYVDVQNFCAHRNLVGASSISAAELPFRRHVWACRIKAQASSYFFFWALSRISRTFASHEKKVSIRKKEAVVTGNCWHKCWHTGG